MSTQILETKSPARLIFTFVILSFAGLTIFFISQHYISTIRQVETQTLERLYSVANTIALQIDGEEHAQMMHLHQSKDAIKDKNGDIIYAKIHQTLKNNLIAADLKSPIYTYVYDDHSKTFNFGVTSSEQPYFRHQYSSPPDELIANREKGGKITTYKDEFGHWLSAFVTIKNKQGSVVAILQVDEKFDTFINYINEKTVRNSIIGLIVFSILSFFLLQYLKKILAQEQKAKEQLSKAYLEKKDLSEKLSDNEQETKKYALRLEQSNQELSDFAQIASHDLKAPIRGILSFAQLFERKNKAHFDERDHEYFNYIKTNTNQALRLIESLLNYSKVDKDIGEPVEIDVLECVENAQTSLSTIFDERNAELKVKDLPHIKAHSLLITQLFQNLINNGIKYNQSEQPCIQISAQLSSTEGYIYAIKDNGIGIPEQYKQDVFAMFRRLHGAGEYEGSGIGLAFCKRLVETYGGRIWFDSEVNKGSTFYFTLPQAEVVNTPKKTEKELVAN
jgi:signal transduction histidine kinase